MSKTNSTLDLTEVASEDTEELAKRIENYYKSDTTAKSTLSYHWDKNHLFLDGKQWIVYDGDRGRGGQWKTLSVSRSNEYIPRPVTNYIIDAYQTLKAYLVQNQPRSTVRPNTQTYRDKQSAKLSELVAETNWERLKEEENYEYAAACLVCYGTVFKKDYWDTSTLQMAKVPRTEQVPVTDPLTGQATGTKEQEVIDPATGQVVCDEIPLGDVASCIVEPQRLALDPLAVDMHNMRWVMEYAIQPLEWIKQVYGKAGEGYTGRVEELKQETSLSNEMQRFVNLRTSSGTKIPGLNQGNSQNGTDDVLEGNAVLKEYYERPTAKYPKGRLVAVANGVTLYSGDSPCEGPDQGDWHPYSECRWERVPGRFWGKSPLDDITELNKQINSIDAVIVLTRKTMAIPQKLIPSDSGVKPGEWNGRPGLEIRHRAGSLPVTVSAEGVDAQVFQERAQKVEDIKTISGAIDIMKGGTPTGVTAASALELIHEVGTGKLRPVLNRWKRFVESSQKKGLRCVSQKYREPRPEFIRMLHAKNKDIPAEVIDRFIGADLYDNCNVLIEAGSNIPKLQSAEKSLLLQLAQIGTLKLDDPKNQLEFNRRMGITGFDNEVGPDVRRAEWENDLLDNITITPDNTPVMLNDDIHEIHKEVHTRRMKEPSFMSMDEKVQSAYMQHVEEHENAIQQAKMIEQQEAINMGGQPSPPKDHSTSPLTKAGNGISEDQRDKAITPDLPGAGS